MAEVIYPGWRENGGGDGNFHLRDTSLGKDFDFQLRRNRVKVSPNGWQKLNEQEKIQIFKAILEDYRMRSVGDDGMKIAALGVTSEGDIYIATNTERLSSPYFRQCAELNMVTAATQSEMYEQRKQGNPEPYEPKFSEFYMVGGVDARPKSHPICPCGNCTDMLRHVMEPGAPMYMLSLKSDVADRVDDTSATVSDVEPGKTWKTDIAALDIYHEVALKKDAAGAQHIGFSAMLRRGSKLAEEERQQLIQTLSPDAKPEMSLHSITELLGYLGDPMKLAALPAEMVQQAKDALGATIKSAENALLQRQSVAAIDVATEHGKPHLADLNRYMVGEIRHAFADRLKQAEFRDADTLNGRSVESLMNEKIGVIRCVVIQLDDGTYRSAVETRTSYDNASPSAEMTALANASRALGTRGVKDAWIMEMAPQDIAKGVMHTSSKEGTERLMKRRSRETQGVNFHFIPFNAGTTMKDQEVAKMSLDVAGRELFPSYFTGSKQMTGKL